MRGARTIIRRAEQKSHNIRQTLRKVEQKNLNIRTNHKKTRRQNINVATIMGRNDQKKSLTRITEL